jgi:type II secretory pathway component GspD/PulD (secretin)
MRSMPGRSRRKCIVSILVIFAMLLFGDGYIIRPVWGAASEINEVVFSLDVKDQPLSSVLRTIHDQTGVNFSVTESAKNVPVTISLNKVPLLEGLNRVLKSTGISSHAVVSDNHKNISISIINKSNLASDRQGKPSGSETIQGTKADQSRSAVSDKDSPTPILPPTSPLQSRSDKNTIASPRSISPPPDPPLQREPNKDTIEDPSPPFPPLQRR